MGRMTEPGIRRRIVVGALGADRAHALARRLRDEGDEVVLTGDDADVESLGRAVVAEDASEVVVGGGFEVERLHGWLNERGLPDVTIRTADDA